MYYIIYTVSILSGNMVGGFLPGMLAGMLSFEPGGAMSYRLTLYVSLAATILSLLPLSYIKEKSSTKNANISHLKVYRSIFQSKTACQMIFIYCLYGIGWGVSLPYFNVYFDTILGANTSQIGIIFSVSQLTMVIGYFLVPLLTEKLGKIRLASMVQVLSIPFLLMFTFTSSVLVAALGYVMRWLLMNMANPVLNSFKLEIVSNEQRPTMNSLTWMACYTFVGIGTYAGGLLMASGQNALPFLITSVFYGITAILYYVYFNEVERGQNA